MERHRSSGLNGGVKIGGLWKRSQGLSRFSRTNYKHRVFILTEQSLSYYSGTVDHVGQLKRRVDLNSVRAVEFVDESAFDLAHTFQVVYVSKKHGFVTLYITATDNDESADWVASIRQACYFNSDMLMHHHPGALLKNKWSCCEQQGKTTLGCQPTYHLLTRSSSRYAQIRRRDTLTSSQNNRRRSKTNSGFTAERTSIASGIHNEVRAIPEMHTKPGGGLSNSCVDLIHHPPHKLEAFSPSPSSRRSSRQSTEPSVSLGNITLTRVSVLTSEGGGEECDDCAGETERGAEIQKRDCAGETERGAEIQKREGVTENKRARSQVAPETNPIAPLTEPFEPESSLSETVKSRPRRGFSLNSGEVTQPFGGRGQTLPRMPSRHRQLPPTSSFSGSISFIPSVTTIIEKSSTTRGLTHSKTFVAPSPATCPPQLRNISCSTSALSKPLIEPRISDTNPNVIHV